MAAHISATPTGYFPEILLRPLSFASSWGWYQRTKESLVDRLSWGTWNEHVETALEQGRLESEREAYEARGFVTEPWDELSVDAYGMPSILNQPQNSVVRRTAAIMHRAEDYYAQAKHLNQLWTAALCSEVRRAAPWLPIPILRSLKLGALKWIQQVLGPSVHVQELFDCYTGLQLDCSAHMETAHRFAHFSPLRPSIDALFPCIWIDELIRVHVPQYAFVTALILNYFKFRSLPSMFAIQLILLLKGGPFYTATQRRVTLLLSQLLQTINWGGNTPCQWARRKQVNEIQVQAMFGIDGFVQQELGIQWAQQNMFDSPPPRLIGTVASEYITATMNSPRLFYGWAAAARDVLVDFVMAGERTAAYLRANGWDVPLNRSGIPSVTLHHTEQAADMLQHFAKICSNLEANERARSAKRGLTSYFPFSEGMNRREALIGIYINGLFAYYHQLREKGLLAMAGTSPPYMTSYHKLGFPMEIFPGYAHFPLSVSASRINHDKPHTLGFKGLCKDHAYEFFFHFNHWSPSRNNVVHDALSVNHGLATSKSSQETATAMRTLSNAARNFGDLNSDLRRAVSVNAGDTSALETTLRNITNRIRSLKPVRPDWHPRVPRRKSPEGEAIAARKAEVLKAMSHLASYHDELPFDDGSDDEEDEP